MKRAKIVPMKNTFEARDFSDISKLIDLKLKKNLKLSVGIPTLNEERTIVNIIRIISRDLMKKYPLVDELAIFDCGSKDRTARYASKQGIKVYNVNNIFPGEGHYQGKGEALWKSLFCLTGDIITWIDADIENFNSYFVLGLVGPLIHYDKFNYVKGFFKRIDRVCDKRIIKEGGRVTELVAKPMIRTLFPKLIRILEPLSGEHAGRRGILEKLSFHKGYGIEINLLIDIAKDFGIETIAQTNLYYKMHRHHSLSQLSEMSSELMEVFFNRAGFVAKDLPERPPMINVAAYLNKFKKG